MSGRGELRRSTRFGVVGLIVVVVAVLAIALAFGSGARPTGALVAIFAVVFAYLAVLLLLQRRDVDAAAARDRLATAGKGEEVLDPTTVGTAELLGALAVRPVDAAAIASANERIWGFARQSISSGAVVVVLIACAVVPFELSGELWSIVVFVPALMAYLIYLIVRLLRPGGTLAAAYDSAGPTLDALGLSERERPRVVARRQPFGPRPMGHELEGESVFEGERHGRPVTVRLGAEQATVRVSCAVGSFEVAAKGERLAPRPGSERVVGDALGGLRASSYWRGVDVRGDAEGVIVRRRGSGGGQHWMRDLWLAERLADAAARGAG